LTTRIASRRRRTCIGIAFRKTEFRRHGNCQLEVLKKYNVAFKAALDGSKI
jgi:hypothetical protein